jgi:hypothetical protein
VGKLFDVAVGLDPKEGKTLGFYILHTAGEAGNDRVVEFFELD